ncbi:hypothetical protein MSG28_008174 [Choristoneura fumiferana]|uniref:Uncharacterized protein n=1 Tax=Choristoneura fumiferana TaxID=7141 RepID=A0ACC0JAA7_CHOFU|nr:hypothetical protein MSG28_008174 [Choristoneura fumiferana]
MSECRVGVGAEAERVALALELRSEHSATGSAGHGAYTTRPLRPAPPTTAPDTSLLIYTHTLILLCLYPTTTSQSARRVMMAGPRLRCASAAFRRRAVWTECTWQLERRCTSGPLHPLRRRALCDPDIARRTSTRWQGKPPTAATSGHKYPCV